MFWYRYKPKYDPNSKTDNASQYRDRAAERRLDSNPDYVETNRILATLTSSTPLHSSATPASAPTPQQFQQTDDSVLKGLDEEQSKYFGGDIKHTHLVKGLDFALLQKVKSEIEGVHEEEAM